MVKEAPEPCLSTESFSGKSPLRLSLFHLTADRLISSLPVILNAMAAHNYSRVMSGICGTRLGDLCFYKLARQAPLTRQYQLESLAATTVTWPPRALEKHFPFLLSRVRKMSSGSLQSTRADKRQSLNVLWHTPLWISKFRHTKQSRVLGARLREIG